MPVDALLTHESHDIAARENEKLTSKRHVTIFG